MLGAAGLFWLMQTQFHWSASTIFLAAGLGTVPVAIYVVCLIPQATVRCIVWIISKPCTAQSACEGSKNPAADRRGALLVANHVSWLDGVLLLLVSTRPIRMLAFSDYVTGWWINWLSTMWNVIPIRNTDGPKALIRSLRVAKEALVEGDLVCIFAEGGITRNGQLQPFQRGLLRIVEGTGCPVIPVYLDELWGSIFSFSGGRFFWKWPRRWPYPVSISFGKLPSDSDNVDQVRQAVQCLGVESVEGAQESYPSAAATGGAATPQEDPFPAQNLRFERQRSDRGQNTGRQPDPAAIAQAGRHRAGRADGRHSAAAVGLQACSPILVVCSGFSGGSRSELHYTLANADVNLLHSRRRHQARVDQQAISREASLRSRLRIRLPGRPFGKGHGGA